MEYEKLASLRLVYSCLPRGPEKFVCFQSCCIALLFDKNQPLNKALIIFKEGRQIPKEVPVRNDPKYPITRYAKSSRLVLISKDVYQSLKIFIIITGTYNHQGRSR